MGSIVFSLTRMEQKEKRQSHDDSALSTQGGIMGICLCAVCADIFNCKNRARLTFLF
jgi:hypothetical protein